MLPAVVRELQCRTKVLCRVPEEITAVGNVDHNLSLSHEETSECSEQAGLASSKNSVEEVPPLVVVHRTCRFVKLAKL